MYGAQSSEIDVIPNGNTNNIQQYYIRTRRTKYIICKGYSVGTIETDNVKLT